MNPPYVFDTSSFRVLANYYADQFPSFWTRFDAAVGDGSILSVREVHRELERWVSASWIWSWVEANKAIFRKPSAEETEFVGQIFSVPHFLGLVGKQQLLTGLPVADPFVIASARISGGCVVTEEQAKPNAAKIPNVCQHFGVHCTNVKGFLEHNGWTF